MTSCLGAGLGATRRALREGASGLAKLMPFTGTSMSGSSGSSDVMRNVPAPMTTAGGVNVTVSSAFPPTGITSGVAGPSSDSVVDAPGRNPYALTVIGSSEPLLKRVTTMLPVLPTSVTKAAFAGSMRMSFGSRHEGTPGVMRDWNVGGGSSARK